MPFENNDTLQKWRMTNIPPEIDKNDAQKKWRLTLRKWHTLRKNTQRLFAKE